MMNNLIRILLLEDNDTDAELVRYEFKRSKMPVELHRADCEEDFVKEIKAFNPHIILSDVNMPAFTGWRALEIVQEKKISVPFIFVSGTLGEELAIESFKRGATDYVLKNQITCLVPAVKRALAEAEEQIKRREAEEALHVSHRFLEITNRHSEIDPLLDECVAGLAAVTGCRAVGIRMLRENGTLPYEASRGLPEDLVEHGAAVSIEKDRCLCINMILGKTVSNSPHFTENGSFYRNSVSETLVVNSKATVQETLVSCTTHGFESVALVPVNLDGSNIGLIHLGDAHPGLVPLRVIRIMEEVAACIATAIHRIWTETAFHESEQKFHSFIDGFQGIVYRFGLDSSLQFILGAVEKITGYSEADFVSGQVNWNDIIYEEDRTIVSEVSDIIRITPGYSTEREYRLVDRSGQVRWINELVQNVCDRKGAPEAVQGIVYDITDKKSLEDQFLQSQKMEAIGRLAGGIAHDFNNLLTAIIGYTDIMVQSVQSGSVDTADITEMLGDIDQAAQQAASMTGQLLAFSRKSVRHPEQIDVNGVIRDMEKILGRLIGEDVVLKTNLADNLESVTGDPGQINQIIMNLAVNARDAMPDGGDLVIETSSITVNERMVFQHLDLRAGPYAVVTVSDTGTGMDPETLKHIFEPFYTTKERGKGTGLGLSTVYGIVRQNGGGLHVYSEPGQGTRFKVYLPLTVGEEACHGTAASVERKKLAAGGSETILLVEDEPMVRKLVCRVLKKGGYTVLDTESITDALGICSRHQEVIDLVVSDVVLPEGSGLELISTLRKRYPEIKVLLMSGYSEATKPELAEAFLNTDFIQKPFTPQTFAAKLRQVLDGEEGAEEVAES